MKIFPYLKLFLDTRSRSVLTRIHARPANPRRPNQRPRSPPGSASRGRAGPHPQGAFPQRRPPAHRLRQGTRRDAAPARRIAQRPHHQRCFGSNDIAAILVRIARGLHRAAALEAWLITWVPRREAASARAPRAASAARRPARGTARRRCRPAQPPTLEDIVARDRRRPIGAVIAEICCDLGIVPNHELWREVSSAVIQGGGSLVTLFRDAVSRLLPVRLFDPSDIARPCMAGNTAARRCRRPRVPARPERIARTIEATCTGPAMAGPAILIPARGGAAARRMRRRILPLPLWRGWEEGSIGGPHRPTPPPTPSHRGGGVSFFASVRCLS